MKRTAVIGLCAACAAAIESAHTGKPVKVRNDF